MRTIINREEMTVGRKKENLFEIDLIKGVCILTVVLGHSINTGALEYKPGLEQFLGDWTRFAVPLFLLVSGFLFNKSGVSTWTLAGKLTKRIVPAYLICSVLMLWLRTMWLRPSLGELNWAQIAGMFIIGEALGIYYFVFVISYLYTFSLWWRHWPIRWLYVLWAVEVIATIMFYVKLPWFFPDKPEWFFIILFRHPVIHLLPYLTGWLLSVHYDEIRPWFRRNSGNLIMITLAADVVLMMIIEKLQAYAPHQLLIQVHVYVFFVGFICLGIRWPINSRIIEFLSKASYGIYLIHFPIVRAIQYAYNGRNAMTLERILVPWIITCLASGLIILCFRGVFGKRSRYIIGG